MGDNKCEGTQELRKKIDIFYDTKDGSYALFKRVNGT